MKLKISLNDSPELLLTPLIDMIFLVVIFFMIQASLSINPAVRVSLPEASSSQSVLEEEVTVTLTLEGGIYIDEEKVEKENFRGRLESLVEKEKQTALFFRGDENISYKFLVEMMDLARLAGIESISLLATRK